jgi:long-chain fatty acid transport protein
VKTFSAAVTLLFATLADLSAIGIRVDDQDAFGTARGDAVTATADNPSALYYNPAGITQLDGWQFRLGAYGIDVDAEYHQPGGRSLHNEQNLSVAPQLYTTWTPKDSRLSLGLGVYAPYGLGLEYTDDAPFRTVSKVGRINYLTVNPVAAWKFGESLSLGFGATVNYVETEARQGIFQPRDEFKFRGAGTAYGFNAGVLWQPAKRHSFGVRYHSATNAELSGHTSVHTKSFEVATPLGPVTVPETASEEDAGADFQFPQFVTAGYSFRPTPDWNFEFDVDWTDWDALNQVVVRQQSSPKIVQPFDWESGWAFEWGATRYLPRGLRASVGYVYSTQVVPESRFTPAVPDGRRHIYSAGLGQETGRFTWDVAYQFAYQPSRTIGTGGPADGDYRLRAHAVSISLGVKF